MMSINLQQVINDARKLSNRLKDDEIKSDALITQAKCTQNQIQHIKQYSEDVEMLNEAASQRSQSVLVAGLQRESQHLRELQAENRELRAALDDYQNALELIMSKYRQQVAKLTGHAHTNEPTFYNSAYTQIILEQCNQIKEMKDVMRRAVAADEQEATKDRETITQLATENQGLREMTNIYKKYGKQNPELPRVVTDSPPAPPHMAPPSVTSPSVVPPNVTSPSVVPPNVTSPSVVPPSLVPQTQAQVVVPPTIAPLALAPPNLSASSASSDSSDSPVSHAPTAKSAQVRKEDETTA